MNNKQILFLLVFIILGFWQASAQYHEETHRQTNDEIQLYKKQGIRMVVLYYQKGDDRAPYGINYYDTGGRVILMVNPNHHEHFSYDNEGRMTYWLDSANDGRRFEKFEYHFSYGPGNHLSGYTTNTTHSVFSSDAGGIKEQVMKGPDIIETHTYTYNQDGKPGLEVFKDTAGKQLYWHKKLYNKYGDLASEIIVHALIHCEGDSSAIINSYDNKGRLIHKQETITSYSCRTNPTAPAVKTIRTHSVAYFYDSKGMLGKETLTSTDPKESYRKEYEYTDDGMIAKESYFDGMGKSTHSMMYHYYYFTRKK